MENKKRTITIIGIFALVLAVIGGTLAYWTWTTNEGQQTNVVFTVTSDFSCAADGGGDITSSDVSLAPTTCTDTSRAIKRKVTVTPTINRDALAVMMDLWLDINDLEEGLSNSENFRYVLTTSENSCEEGTIIASGNFKGLNENNKVILLSSSDYTSASIVPETYWLYIWLDAAETSSDTMNQSFNFSLNGSCTDDIFSFFLTPEAPVLDEGGMIPVVIADNGEVTTILSNDSEWYEYYNYFGSEWANAILVNNANRSKYLNTTGVPVSPDDILAYYVWIPRYKYRIPKKTCSSISVEDRNIEDYPECYAPYTINEADKPNLISFIQMYVVQYVGVTNYTREQASLGLENALKTGKFVVEYNGSEQYMFITEAVNTYNSQTGANIILESSEFNSSNIMTNNYGPRKIDILFETADAAVSTGNAVTTYRTHPAFIWDGKTVAGIWVGKFETTPDKSSTCYSSPDYNTCNNTTQNPTILPNESSLRYQDIGNQFTTSQNISKNGNVYGLTYIDTDAHMMKNSEWGAVTYLSHSDYGINKEIRINNYWNRTDNKYTLTGCGAATSTTTSTVTTCSIAYGSGVSEYPQSTTGNISGVFDMSGGAYEYVMGNYGNTTNSTYIPTLPDTKYYDLYSSAQFTGDYETNTDLCTLKTCGGHALNETAGWYSDFAYFVDLSSPWFVRGGNDGSHAGAFYFNRADGSGGNGHSWRSVLIVD